MRALWWSLIGLLVILLVAVGVFAAVPHLAQREFGPPASWLSLPQVVEYSAKVLWADGLLTAPFDPGAGETEFEVEPGEGVLSICSRLEQLGLVPDGGALRDYLIYTGQDTSLQAGMYTISAAMSAIEIARQMQDPTPTEVEFVVLAGWRIEEIAATLPTSGLGIPPEEFIRAAHSPRSGHDFLDAANSMEGFLFPGSYVLSRSTGINELLDGLVRRFSEQVDDSFRSQLASQGLTVREAVILASIIQREAIHLEEAPLIASVFLNRLSAGMPLDADPTVQYALGFNPAQQTWWTNPLSLDDLKVDSPYNTYLNAGLPPAPIANPGLEALEAIAEPAASPYLFFNARCDGSGFHVFSATFQDHLNSLCP